MNCKHPILIKYRKKSKSYETPLDYMEKDLLVPCRKCPYCQRKLSLEWVRRLLHEYESYNYTGSFITLTYDEPFLPEDGVSKEALRSFIKRLRKNSKRIIKFYACGEYGEKNGRPHYHLIVTNLSPREKEIVQKSWKFGIVDCKPLQYGSAKYVVDYMNKDIPEEIIADRTEPFTLKSNGIGLNWFTENLNNILEMGGMYEKQYKVSIPRYYLKKLKDLTISSLGDVYYEELTKLDPEQMSTWEEYCTKYHEKVQFNRNLAAKKQLKK